jgi:chromosome segregation ATPase
MSQLPNPGIYAAYDPRDTHPGIGQARDPHAPRSPAQSKPLTYQDEVAAEAVRDYISLLKGGGIEGADDAKLQQIRRDLNVSKDRFDAMLANDKAVLARAEQIEREISQREAALPALQQKSADGFNLIQGLERELLAANKAFEKSRPATQGMAGMLQNCRDDLKKLREQHRHLF